MLNAKRIAFSLLLATFQPTAYAGGVYQCTGNDGEATFSFAPCATFEPQAEINESVTGAVLPVDEIHNTAVQAAPEEQIDQRIEALETALDELRIDYNRSMEALEEDEGSHELTAAFDDASTVIVEELMTLYQQRHQFAGR